MINNYFVLKYGVLGRKNVAALFIKRLLVSIYIKIKIVVYETKRHYVRALPLQHPETRQYAAVAPKYGPYAS